MPVILIVEDEAPIRVLAESVLQHAGYDTVSAGSLAEAQAVLESDQEIDLLFTDLALGADSDAGFQLGRMAAEHRIPVLYTSGRALTDGMQALFVERSLFLPKPYTDEAMVNSVAELLRGQGHN